MPIPSIHVAMDDRHRRVIEQRAAGLTLQQIGDELGVTRERVRKIEAEVCMAERSYRRVKLARLLGLSSMRQVRDLERFMTKHGDVFEVRP